MGNSMGNLVPAQTNALAQAIGEQQYLTFLLGGEMFAIEILNIREIIEYGALTTVPMMPPFIRGVINLRGAVVPVIDLSVRFGRPPVAVTRRTCIIIIEIDNAGERQDIGVVVDSVSEVLEIPANMVEPPPTFGARVRTDFIQGMGKVNDKFVIILNVHNVLSVDEMSQLSQAAQLGGAASVVTEGAPV
jgi:purine-binding chemotaxis protein CheW